MTLEFTERPNQDLMEFISSVEVSLSSAEIRKYDFKGRTLTVLTIEGETKTHTIPLRDAEVGAILRNNEINDE